MQQDPYIVRAFQQLLADLVDHPVAALVFAYVLTGLAVLLVLFHKRRSLARELYPKYVYWSTEWTLTKHVLGWPYFVVKWTRQSKQEQKE